MKRITAVILAAALLVLCLCGLAGCKNDSKNFPVTVAGLTIEKRPEKVVCLSVEYTEIIVRLGYTSVLAGRPYDCTHADVQNIISVGTSSSPAVDIITGLEPNLVIADTTTPTESLEAINAAGVPVLQLLPPTTRTAFSNLYRCIGSAIDGATDGYQKGDEAARSILIRMDDVERAVALENSLNVVIFTNDLLTKGVTGDSLGSLAIELAGGFNLAIESQHGNVDFDAIASSDPDVILCPDGCLGTVRSMRDFQQCAAMENNAVYVYDASKLNSLGDDLVVGTWELARLIHPDLISADMLPEGAVDYLPTDDGYVMDGDEYADYLAEQEAANQEEEEPGFSLDDLIVDEGE